jgi:hypothetical protein
MSDISEPAPVEPVAEAEPAPAISPARSAIDRWFNAHIPGSPVARSVDAYNHLRAVLGHLESEIARFFEQEI